MTRESCESVVFDSLINRPTPQTIAADGTMCYVARSTVEMEIIARAGCCKVCKNTQSLTPGCRHSSATRVRRGCIGSAVRASSSSEYPWVYITGDGDSQNLDWGTLMQIVLTDFVILQNFKQKIACITTK